MLDYSKEAIAEDKEGIYLVGCTTFDPFTNEQFYFLKIGYSKNVKKRLKTGYGTHCPNIFNIANLYKKPKGVESIKDAEAICHSFLNDWIGKRFKRNCVEWYQVPKSTYIAISSMKESFFNMIFENREKFGKIMLDFLINKLKEVE